MNKINYVYYYNLLSYKYNVNSNSIIFYKLTVLKLLRDYAPNYIFRKALLTKIVKTGEKMLKDFLIGFSSDKVVKAMIDYKFLRS